MIILFELDYILLLDVTHNKLSFCKQILFEIVIEIKFYLKSIKKSSEKIFLLQKFQRFLGNDWRVSDKLKTMYFRATDNHFQWILILIKCLIIDKIFINLTLILSDTTIPLFIIIYTSIENIKFLTLFIQ